MVAGGGDVDDAGARFTIAELQAYVMALVAVLLPMVEPGEGRLRDRTVDEIGHPLA